jgi:hypothetical protein
MFLHNPSLDASLGLRFIVVVVAVAAHAVFVISMTLSTYLYLEYLFSQWLVSLFFVTSQSLIAAHIFSSRNYIF